MKLSDFEIAGYTSCLRDMGLSTIQECSLIAELPVPTQGDLLLGRALNSVGAYDYVEYGKDSKHHLSEGEHIVLVLGERYSSTHVYGTVPQRPLNAGDTIHQVSGAAMAADAHYVPSWFGGDTSRYEIVGFVSRDGKDVVNLQSLFPTLPIAPEQTPARCLFIGGTSAQVGKTTFARNLIRGMKEISPETKIAVIKATGTSSSKYLDLYKDAGADFATDYVHQGHPSTYGLDENVYREVLENMILQCSAQADVVVIELGGDLYEGNSPMAVQVASELGSDFVLVANDAMGAAEATKFMKDRGVANIFISSFRQNLYSLAQRLQFPVSNVIDMNIPKEMKKLGARNIGISNMPESVPDAGLESFER